MPTSTELLLKYPHMFPRDVEIWERFLQSFESDYAQFKYDIKVGVGTKDIEGRDDVYARAQEILSKYRIDAVGFKINERHIIEVKPQATTSGIGQVMVYKELYERDFDPSLPVIPMIVTDYEMPDMRYLTRQLGIQYIVV